MGDPVQNMLNAANSKPDRAPRGIRRDPYPNLTAQVTLFGDPQAEATLRVSQMTAAVELIEAAEVTQLPRHRRLQRTIAALGR